MSYQAGISGFGAADRSPVLVCDQCGTKRSVTRASGMPYAWFLDRKAAPGWAFDGSADMRRDWCPECKPPRVAS